MKNPIMVALFVLLCIGKVYAQNCKLGLIPDSLHFYVNGAIYDAEKVGNTLYVGGDFTNIGKAIGNFFPVDNNNQIVDLNTRPKINGADVSCAIQDGNGGWIIGGTSLNIEDSLYGNLIHIKASGQITSLIPNNNNEIIHALALQGNRLYVGGYFYHIGTNYRENLAVIDITTGLVTNDILDADNAVYALHIDGNKLYAGGRFTYIKGQRRYGIGCIDIPSNTLTTLKPKTDGYVYAIGTKNNTLYIGGTFSEVNNEVRSNFASIDINTQNINSLNPIVSGTIRSLLIDNNVIYIGGNFNNINNNPHKGVAIIDINTGIDQNLPIDQYWSIYSSSPQIGTLAKYNNTLYVGGEFSITNGTIIRTNLLAIDLNTKAITSWNPDLKSSKIQTIVPFNNNIYIGGTIISTNNFSRNNLAAIDLLTGTPTTFNPTLNNIVFTIKLKDGLVYAGGQFHNGINQTGLIAIDISTSLPTSWNPLIYNTRKIVLDDNNIYAMSPSYLHSINRLTGHVNWTQYVGDNSGLVLDSTLYIASFQLGLSTVDTATGNIFQWQVPISGQSIIPRGDTLFVGFYDELFMIDKNTKSIINWNFGVPLSPIQAMSADNDNLYMALNSQYVRIPYSTLKSEDIFYSKSTFTCNKLMASDKLYVLGADITSTPLEARNVYIWENKKETPTIEITHPLDLCGTKEGIFTLNTNITNANYQWYKNGNYVNSGNTYTYKPQNNDKITVVGNLLNTKCYTASTGTGNLTVNSRTPVIPAINLAGPISVSPGHLVSLSGSVNNAGNTYKILWQQNGSYIGETDKPNKSFTKSWVNDTISVKLIPDGAGCYTNDTAYGSIIIAVNTGIDDINNTDINIYPNPFTTHINISGVSLGDRIQIFDLNGYLILNKTIPSNDAISLQSLTPGNYFIRILDKDNTLKITKSLQKK